MSKIIKPEELIKILQNYKDNNLSGYESKIVLTTVITNLTNLLVFKKYQSLEEDYVLSRIKQIILPVIRGRKDMRYLAGQLSSYEVQL